ncbi:hypothetical protein [Streptomyces milbemycinicus]|uniref:Transposase n=1 Tax=Streptomyces milbemycinicus TaxID=476552 RepID=A0ABW8M2K8_9ACTN
MASDLDPQQVEIIGRRWLIGERVRAASAQATPKTDKIGLAGHRLGP